MHRYTENQYWIQPPEGSYNSLTTDAVDRHWGKPTLDQIQECMGWDRMYKNRESPPQMLATEKKIVIFHHYMMCMEWNT